MKEKIKTILKYIEKNYTNPNGKIWHREMREIYKILKGEEKND